MGDCENAHSNKFVLTGHMLIKLGKLDLECVCFHRHTRFGGVLTIIISSSNNTHK